MTGDTEADRLDRLERRVDETQTAIAVLISLLPDDLREHLEAGLDPLRRRLTAERPRGTGEWPDEGLRRLSAAVSLIEEGLLNADPAGA